MLMFGLRLGDNPKVCVTTTPRATGLIKSLVADPRTILFKGTTYENRLHLAPSFFTDIITRYEGTRLGEQELNAQLLDITEGAWFPMFSVARHVSAEAEFHPAFSIRAAIDAGASRHTGAVFFQVRPHHSGWPKVTVFGDYHGARHRLCRQCRGDPGQVHEPDRARSRFREAGSGGVGAVVAGPGGVQRICAGLRRAIHRAWPDHLVADGLDQIELMLGGEAKEPMLLIHPRCTHLVQAFQNYRREERHGEFLDKPLDPQHPAEDLMDALRGGIRDVMPEGRKGQSGLRTISARQMF